MKRDISVGFTLKHQLSVGVIGESVGLYSIGKGSKQRHHTCHGRPNPTAPRPMVVSGRGEAGYINPVAPFRSRSLKIPSP